MKWSECKAIERDSRKVSGTWVFKNTRVPVSALFDNIDSVATVDEFLEWFPGDKNGSNVEYKHFRLPIDRALALDRSHAP